MINGQLKSMASKSITDALGTVGKYGNIANYASNPLSSLAPGMDAISSVPGLEGIGALSGFSKQAKTKCICPIDEDKCPDKFIEGLGKQLAMALVEAGIADGIKQHVMEAVKECVTKEREKLKDAIYDTMIGKNGNAFRDEIQKMFYSRDGDFNSEITPFISNTFYQLMDNNQYLKTVFETSIAQLSASATGPITPDALIEAMYNNINSRFKSDLDQSGNVKKGGVWNPFAKKTAVPGAPVAPLSVAPAPGAPLSVAPAPGAPLSVAPAPGAPLSVAPAPGAPAPVAPVAGAPALASDSAKSKFRFLMSNFGSNTPDPNAVPPSPMDPDVVPPLPPPVNTPTILTASDKIKKLVSKNVLGFFNNPSASVVAPKKDNILNTIDRLTNLFTEDPSFSKQIKKTVINSVKTIVENSRSEIIDISKIVEPLFQPYIETVTKQDSINAIILRSFFSTPNINADTPTHANVTVEIGRKIFRDAVTTFLETPLISNDEMNYTKFANLLKSALNTQSNSQKEFDITGNNQTTMGYNGNIVPITGSQPADESQSATDSVNSTPPDDGSVPTDETQPATNSVDESQPTTDSVDGSQPATNSVDESQPATEPKDKTKIQDDQSNDNDSNNNNFNTKYDGGDDGGYDGGNKRKTKRRKSFKKKTKRRKSNKKNQTKKQKGMKKRKTMKR